MNLNNKQFSFVEIISTAFITAILTSLSSFFLISYQLSEEQDYWIERLHKERLTEKIEKQTLLFEDINVGILHSEILTREVKILASAFNVETSIARASYTYKGDYSSVFVKKLTECQQYNYQLIAKMQMIPLYFSNDVNLLINPLTKLLQENYDYNLSVGDKVNLDSISEYIKKDYETIKELEAARLNLLKIMIKDMKLTTTELFRDLD